jgi:hypothetical protein
MNQSAKAFFLSSLSLTSKMSIEISLAGHWKRPENI